MSLHMTYVSRRNDSSHLQFRMRLPKRASGARGQRVVISFPNNGGEDPFTVEVTLGDEVKFSLRTADPVTARARDADARAQLEKYFAAAEAPPTSLSHKQRVALSGIVYRLYVKLHEDNPGSPGAWAAFKAFNRAASEGRVVTVSAIVPGEVGDPAEAVRAFGEDLTAGVNALPIANDPVGLERRFGLAVDWILAQQGLAIGPDDRTALMREVARAATEAGWQLKRNAQGDYTPDLSAARFPPFEKNPELTLSELFERWKAEVKPAPSTVTTWSGVIRAFTKHLGHEDVRRITDADVIAFKDALVASDLSPITVNGSYLAALRTLFNFGVANKLVPQNPADKVKVAARRTLGERQLPYDDDEVARLLRLAEHETNPARRWLPPLAALTGARIGELAQLWGEAVGVENGIPFIQFQATPDGGRLKNPNSERRIPIHPALVKAGFLEFVKARGKGPLFYRRSSGRPNKRHAAKGVANHLADWIRRQGFYNPRKAPNHALRHWFKTAASRADIQDSLADAIQGHAGRSVAARYRHFDLKTLARAIAAIPVPYVEADDQVHADRRDSLPVG